MRQLTNFFLLGLATHTYAINVCEWHWLDINGFRAHRAYSQQTHVMPWEVLAIMDQESSFNPYAMADRRPWLKRMVSKKKISAYGYAQATDATWKDFNQKAAKTVVSRSNYLDSVAFIYWLVQRNRRLQSSAQISTYQDYLNYYNGPGVSHKKKNQPMKGYSQAQQVVVKSNAYKLAWKRCESGLQWRSDWMPMG